MKKKRSIGKLVVICALSLLLTVLTIFSFALFGTWQDSDFVGFARAVNFGVEYRGGTVKTYQANLNTVTNENFYNAVQINARRIEYLLDGEGYDTNAYSNGNNIVVEFLEEDSPVGIDDIINAKAYFAIKTEQSDTAAATVSASDVLDAYATTNAGQSILVITFTSEGATHFQTAIDSGTGYFYIGANSPFSLSLTNANSAYVGIVTSSLDTANSYASQILAAKYDMSFEEIDSVEYTTADAKANVVKMLVLSLGLFVVIAVLLIALFRKLGLIGTFIMFISLLLQILLLQAVPENVFTFTGLSLLASLLAMAVGAVTLFVMFNNMHKEYKNGKILSASVKFGYSKSWAKMIDMYVLLLVPTILAYAFGSFVVKQFAMAFICGLAVYGIITIVLTKFMTKWLTYICFKNKDYGFKREANVNELK